MNWDEAMRAMRDGAQIRWVSEAIARFDGAAGCKHEGREPAKLVIAYNEFGLQHRVLVGAWSGMPSLPTKQMREATDWIALPKCEVLA